MSSSDARDNRCRVYVGNLPDDIQSGELVDGLSKYGRVKDADIKFGRTRNGTAYAFIEYEDPEGAERAVNEGDGASMFGVYLKVEFTGVRKPKSRPYDQAPYMGSGPPQRSEYRVVVFGLPRHTSWQDLKDHMRGAGSVGYAHVDEDGVGVVEYSDRRGVEKALDVLHQSTIETHLRRTGQIQVYLPEDAPYPPRGSRSHRSASPYSRRRGGGGSSCGPPRRSGYGDYSSRGGYHRRSPSRSPSPRHSRREAPRRGYSSPRPASPSPAPRRPARSPSPASSAT